MSQGAKDDLNKRVTPFRRYSQKGRYFTDLIQSYENWSTYKRDFFNILSTSITR